VLFSARSQLPSAVSACLQLVVVVFPPPQSQQSQHRSDLGNGLLLTAGILISLQVFNVNDMAQARL
jgi:hypothetical protein